jgi:hypothetical protein
MSPPTTDPICDDDFINEFEQYFNLTIQFQS